MTDLFNWYRIESDTGTTLQHNRGTRKSVFWRFSRHVPFTIGPWRHKITASDRPSGDFVSTGDPRMSAKGPQGPLEVAP